MRVFVAILITKPQMAAIKMKWKGNESVFHDPKKKKKSNLQSMLICHLSDRNEWNGRQSNRTRTRKEIHLIQKDNNGSTRQFFSPVFFFFLFILFWKGKLEEKNNVFFLTFLLPHSLLYCWRKQLTRIFGKKNRPSQHGNKTRETNVYINFEKINTEKVNKNAATCTLTLSECSGRFHIYFFFFFHSVIISFSF